MSELCKIGVPRKIQMYISNAAKFARFRVQMRELWPREVRLLKVTSLKH